MDDPISRKAAIDAVSRGCQEFRGIFAECEKNLNKLPPAHLEPCDVCKWKDEHPWTICSTCPAEGVDEIEG